MKIESLDPPIEIETGSHPVASVIWLHGLGADGHDFEPIVPELNLPVGLPLRFVFPHAPNRPVTWNNGYVMRAWYDISVTERGFYQNPAHLLEAEAIVHEYVARERARGVTSAHILLAGFSQGGAVAMHAGLHYSSALAGILSLSAPMPYLDRLLANVNPANRNTPIFMAHGDQDAVVPFGLGQRAQEQAVAAGLNVQWHRYGMGHSVCAEEIADISRWLQGVVAAAAPA